MIVGPPKIKFQKLLANAVSLDFDFLNVFFLNFHGNNDSGILNVFESNKHLKTMPKHWVVQIR